MKHIKSALDYTWEFLKIVACFGAFFFIANLLTLRVAEAKLCKTFDRTGDQVFKFVGDRPTKTLGGTVSLLTVCPDEFVEVRKEVVQELLVKNPVNACERSAINACEPSFGGLPVCNTNNFENFCGFCLVTTQSEINDTLVTKRYINGLIYDGSKAIGETIACPNPALLK